MERAEIEHKLAELTQTYGKWAYDIPLPFGLWTNGNGQAPALRLKRVVQIASDLLDKPLSESRILDLGCLEGQYSIEFAQQGAEVIGVEIREANVQKALFCKAVLDLPKLAFRQADVRAIAVESYGHFDLILCSGILYHLPAADAIKLIGQMFAMTNRAVIIDTRTALDPAERYVHEGTEYWGWTYREHADQATPEEKAKKGWASADNPTSFWFTRPSLVNLLSKAGFSSVYECFTPTLLQPPDRCTFVAMKGTRTPLKTAPTTNALQPQWPETALRYAPAALPLRLRVGRLGRKALLTFKQKLRQR